MNPEGTEAITKAVDPTIIDIVLKNTIGSESAWFWSMFQAIVILVTLLMIFRQVHLQRIANMLSALHTFDERWESKEMVAARIDVCGKAFSNDLSMSNGQDRVMVFFEDMGMQVKRKILDKELVWDTYSVYIEHYWLILKPLAEEQWNKGDKTFYADFKLLHEIMSQVSKKKNVKPEKSREELEAFVASEKSREKIEPGEVVNASAAAGNAENHLHD